MEKPEQFLWMVQTLLLSNAINLASDPDRADRYRHEISATGMFGNCEEALRASSIIPPSMTASDAAHDFVFYIASNLREADDAAGETAKRVPAWFGRS